MIDWDDISLYHYTTFQALEGILKNKEIWLGNLKYMNDRAEMKYFFQRLQATIIEDLPEYEDTTKKLFEEKTAKLEGKTAFAFSLSRLNDDAAQWDRYSNGGRGICIRFSASKLQNVIKDKAALQPVFYDESLKGHQLKAFIEYYIMEGKISNGFKSIDDYFENGWFCSMAFKHPSFKTEEEVRVCSRPLTLYKTFVGDLKYLASSNGLREYYPIKLCFDNEHDYGGCIEEIILGPCSSVDKNMFYRYLQSINVDKNAFSIGESKCPLR